MDNDQVVATPSSNSPFNTEHLHGDLKSLSVRGGAATVLGQGARFVIQVGSTMVLARLLAPADFGLIAMVMAVTGFAALFKDLGLSMATIQRAEINHEQVSTLFWVNVAVSGLIAMLTVAMAPVIAWFYGEPRLTLVTIALSTVFLFGGLTVQHQALLERQMRFAALAAIQVAAMAAGVCAAIVTAALGFGYWALVVMQVTSALAIALGVWLLSDWRPGRPRRNAGVKGMLVFGANLTGFNILNYFARNLDNVLIGKVWGAIQLGLYNKAYGLLTLPINQVTAPIASVAIPSLSRLQSNPDEYARYYYRAINVIAFVTMPMMMMLAGLSNEVILLVLGDQWAGAVPIFKVLAFAALLQPVVNPVGWVFVSLGKTDKQLRWAVFAVPMTVLSFVAGLPWGAFGVAVSYTICSLTILTFPGLWWAFRESPLSIGGWLGSIRCPFVASMCMYIVIETAHYFFGLTHDLLIILLSFMMASACFVLIIMIWKSARTQLYEAWRILHYLKSSDEGSKV